MANEDGGVMMARWTTGDAMEFWPVPVTRFLSCLSRFASTGKESPQFSTR